MAKEFKEVSEQLSRLEPRYTEGAGLMADFADLLRNRRLLPESLETLKESKKSNEPTDEIIPTYFGQLTEMYQVALAHKSLSMGSAMIFWEEAWTEWGKRIDTAVEVPRLEAFLERDINLNTREAGNEPLFYVPELTLAELSKIFPTMAMNLDGLGISLKNRSGWRFGENNIDAPYLDSTPANLQTRYREQNRDGMDLREYIILSQFTKLTRGSYLDQHLTASRLLGSMRDNFPVIAKFNPSGSLSLVELNYRGDNVDYVG